MSNYSYLDTTTADLDYPLYFPSTSIDFVNSKSIPPEYTFTRNSAGTYVGPDGFIKTANANQPRFDYDPITKEFKGLLIEEQRTNLITYSESQLGAFSLEAASINNNFAIAPDGTLTAVRFNESISPAEHRIRKTAATTSGQVVTLSAFVKENGRKYVWLKGDGSGGAWFNLETRAVSLGSGTIKSVGNGWLRITTNLTFNSTNGNNLYAFWLQTSTIEASQNSIAGDGISGILFWGLQVEAGSFPTSYIPTAGSTVTRLADQLVLNQSLSTSGTFFIEARPTMGTTLVADNGTNSFLISPTLNTTTKNTLYYNTNRVLTMSSSSTPSQFINFQSTSGLNRVSLGFDRFNNSSYINGHIKNFKYYDSPVTEDNLRSLTGSNKNISRSDGTIVTSGLVLNLDAGNPSSYPGSGTTWTDLSGNGNNGTLTNGPTYSSANGGSIVFDGVNGRVIIPNPILSSTGNWSISSWFNISALPVAVTNDAFNLFSQYIAVVTNGRLCLFVRNDGTVVNKFEIFLGSGADYSSQRIIGTTTVQTNTFYNLVATRNGSNFNLYVNGNLDVSQTLTGINITVLQSTPEIGGCISGNFGYFNGRISNTTIYNRALTATEVQQNFNALRGRFGI